MAGNFEEPQYVEIRVDDSSEEYLAKKVHSEDNKEHTDRFLQIHESEAEGINFQADNTHNHDEFEENEESSGNENYDHNAFSDKARLSETLEQHLLHQRQSKPEKDKPTFADAVAATDFTEISSFTSETTNEEKISDDGIQIKTDENENLLELNTGKLEEESGRITRNQDNFPEFSNLPIKTDETTFTADKITEESKELAENVPETSDELTQTFKEDLIKISSQTKSKIISMADEAKLKIDSPKSTKKGALRSNRNSVTPYDTFEISSQLEKKLKYLDGPSSSSIIDKPSLSKVDSTDKKLRFGEEEKETRRDDVRLTSKGMRFEYGRSPKTCEKYLSVQEFARTFVDEIADEAISKQRNFKQQSSIKIAEGIAYKASEESLSIASIGTYVCILEWPTIEQFTVDIGIAKISEYLSYWKFEEQWKYCINFLHGESDAACDFYRYEAIFSIPCKQYPIPQATASVFFTFELSRIRPKHCLVDVYYHFEGQRLIHMPGKFTFQEERLFNIIDAKLKFYKTLTF